MSYSVSSSRYSFQQQLLLQPQLDILSSEDGVFGLDLSCPCLLEQLKNLEMRLDYGNLPVLLLKMPLPISLEYYLLIYLCFSTVPFLLLPSKSQEKKRLFHWFNKIISVRVEDFIRDFSKNKDLSGNPTKLSHALASLEWTAQFWLTVREILGIKGGNQPPFKYRCDPCFTLLQSVEISISDLDSLIATALWFLIRNDMLYTAAICGDKYIRFGLSNCHSLVVPGREEHYYSCRF